MNHVRIFVAGGAGGVGAGVVEAWLDAGATVLTTSRSRARLEALRSRARDYKGTLIAIEGDGSAQPWLEHIASEHGPFDQVVASVGGSGWQLAPLQMMPQAMFEQIVRDGIVAHWTVAKALRPMLVHNGSYIFINGGAAKKVLPGTGPLSLVAKAQLALAEIFAAEQPSESELRTISLVLTSPVQTPARGDHVQPAWLTPREVGEACVRLHGRRHVRGEVSVGSRDEVYAL